MTGMEIFLIMTGIIAIVGSFVFSERLEKADTNTGNVMDKLNEEAIQKKVNEAVDSILDEKVEETEVRIEKILNEKIMTVGEYSDNVISDISKSHDEVMFLYGMLNDKEKDIKKAVIDVENLKKSIKKKEHVHSQAADTEGDSKKDNERSRDGKAGGVKADTQVRENIDAQNNVEEPKEFKITVGSPATKNSGVAMSAREVREKSNNNKRILDLYKQGRTSIEIAKELKLGLGEVRLVIDLYKNR